MGRGAVILQSTVGTRVGSASGSSADAVPTLHSAAGVRHSSLKFRRNFYSDMVLLLRWLYDGEEPARRCMDDELLDCLARDVVLSCVLGSSPIVSEPLLQELRVLLYTLLQNNGIGTPKVMQAVVGWGGLLFGSHNWALLCREGGCAAQQVGGAALGVTGAAERPHHY